MRKWCPNFDSESGLDTVLEVPIPEEVFSSEPNTWYALKAWMKPRRNGRHVRGPTSELQRLLGATGVSLIPLPLKDGGITDRSIKDHPNMEAAMAKYIVEQFVAATGGHAALNSVKSMYAMGKVRMTTSDLNSSVKKVAKAATNVGSGKGSGVEVGGFVFWQKNPDLWCIELVVDGCKITAGSDGKVAWRQTPWHPSHASRGPPRHLRRSLQGLDPKSTAMLFSNSVCVGEKPFNGEACFVLKFQAEPSTLKGQSSKNVEMIRHTVWGYFSQRSGLLVQLQDSHLLRLRDQLGSESTCWETTMKSWIQDYRLVDGIFIAHQGRTEVSLFRFDETTGIHSTTRMEESWTIEEIDFNIWGLTMDCFLPPSDLKKEQEVCDAVLHDQTHGSGSKSASPRDVFTVANDETDSGEED